MTGTAGDLIPIVIVPVLALAFLLGMVYYANSHPQWANQPPTETGSAHTLEGSGPFTAFAPTNEAFAKLPAGTVDMLLKPENKAMLTKVLTYHVVPGKVTSKDLKKMIEDGGGKAEIKTVEGGTITAMVEGGKIALKDEKGGTSTVTIADVYQSNGVIHVVDTVLMPN